MKSIVIEYTIPNTYYQICEHFEYWVFLGILNPIVHVWNEKRRQVDIGNQSQKPFCAKFVKSKIMGWT